MPCVSEKITGVSVNNIQRAVPAIGGQVGRLRELAQHDHAVQHGDGFAVPVYRHIVSDDICILMEDIQLPVRDVDALCRLFLEGDQAAGVHRFPSACEYDISGQQKLDPGHQADVGVGVQKVPQFRRGRIFIMCDDGRKHFQLLPVIVHIHLNIVRQTAGFLVKPLKTSFFLHAADGSGRPEGNGYDQENQYDCGDQRAAPLYIVLSLKTFLISHTQPHDVSLPFLNFPILKSRFPSVNRTCITYQFPCIIRQYPSPCKPAAHKYIGGEKRLPLQ